jgi:hypothetical protein
LRKIIAGGGGRRVGVYREWHGGFLLGCFD